MAARKFQISTGDDRVTPDVFEHVLEELVELLTGGLGFCESVLACGAVHLPAQTVGQLRLAFNCIEAGFSICDFSTTKIRFQPTAAVA